MAMPDLIAEQGERVATRRDVPALASTLQPDVVIAATPTSGESTLPFLSELYRRASPRSRIVLMTARFDPDELVLSEDIGIVAQLQWRDLHPQTLPQLLNALIVDDLVITSREVMAALVAARCRVPWVVTPPTELTPRELEVLQLLSDGLSEKEIAQIQGVSRRSVERQVGNLEHKLDAHTQFALAIKAARLGIVG